MIRRLVTIVSLAAVVLGAGTGCHPLLPSRVSFLGAKSDAAHPATYNGLPLRNGQLILTESPESTSFAFALIPEHFYPFTHAGIVSMEGGEPWVYEVSGAIVALPLHSRVLDNVSGQVHRRKFLEYVSPNLYGEIMDVPPGVDGEKVVAYAKKAFADGVEFDAFFDYSNHEKLFCTELVELALEAGGAAPAKLDRINSNPSLAIALHWLGVPADRALPAGEYWDPARYVGALGQFGNRTQAYLYFEAKRELHRRFQKNQRLGFLFHLTDEGQLQVRPQVLNFAYDATELFDQDPHPPEPGDPRIREAVRKFADATLGPAPDAP